VSSLSSAAAPPPAACLKGDFAKKWAFALLDGYTLPPPVGGRRLLEEANEVEDDTFLGSVRRFLKGGNKPKPKPLVPASQIGFVSMKLGGTYTAQAWINMGKGVFPVEYTGNWTFSAATCSAVLNVAGQTNKISAFMSKDKKKVFGSVFNDKQVFSYKMEEAASACTKATLAPTYQYSGIAVLNGKNVAYSARETYSPNGKFTTMAYFSTEPGPVMLGGNWTISTNCVLTRVTTTDKYVALVAADKDIIYLNAGKGIDGGVGVPAF
jgi:hypothetical protein